MCFVSIPYISFLSKTYFLLHPLPTIAPLICPIWGCAAHPYGRVGSCCFGQRGRQPERGRDAEGEQAGTVKALLPLRSSTVHRPPPRRTPPPTEPKVGPETQGREGQGFRAAGGGMLERRLPHPGEPPDAAAAVAAAPSHWRAPASQVAPSRRVDSPHSQVSASPAPSSPPTPFPPLQRGQRSGAPRTPRHSPREGGRCC